MLKSNRGITLLTLTITIVVLLILATITTDTGISTIRSSKYYNALSQMQVMKSKVDTLYEEYKNQNEAVLNYGVATTDSSCDQTILEETFLGAGISDTSGYRFYSESYIKNELDIEGISYEFLVNVQTRDVILFNGIEYQGEMYYTAEDFGIENITYVKINQITFDVAYDENSGNILVYNFSFVDEEANAVDINKYTIEYKKTSDTVYEKVDVNNKQVYTEEGINYEAIAIPITEEGKYSVKLSIEGEDVVGENNIEITL